jgi:hypothetical protein
MVFSIVNSVIGSVPILTTETSPSAGVKICLVPKALIRPDTTVGGLFSVVEVWHG